MLKIIPLGGFGEIGLNMMLFEDEDTMFIVDAGLMFPEDYMHGVDFVIPDFRYLREKHGKVAGIILTHAHEDHVGALPFLLREINVPVFGTPFTMGVVKNKLEDHGLLSSARLHNISPDETVRFGRFEIGFIRVCHSVVDGIGLAVNTAEGLVLHTGDFKIGHLSGVGMMTDVNRFAWYGDKGVLALLSDSTNVEKEGYTIGEDEIGEVLAGIARKSKGRIIVALFASSVNRIKQIIEIALALGRKIVFDGRSIANSVCIAKELGYVKLPPVVEIDIGEVASYPDEEIMIITTGSQGEPMASLSRMAAGNHKHIRIQRDDTIILSSKFIPGNERAITAIINNLYRQGADVIYEKISHIHVSGHAFREELKLMINLTKPKFFVPIHGEYRHLTLHSRLAEQVGIDPRRILLAENGQVIEFIGNTAGIRDRVPTGRVMIDGKGVGDVGRSVLKERQLLSEDGFVVVNMAFDEDTGVVVYGPEVVSRGFVFETATGYLLQDAQCVILEIVEEVGPEVPDRIQKIRKRIQTALRKYFSFTIRRHPVILPFIQEI